MIFTQPGRSLFLVHPQNTGELRINLATPIVDYHGDNVQTIFAIDQPSKRVQAVATYDIANSKCAVLSKADWVVLNPANAASQQNVDEEVPEDPESVSYVPEEEEEAVE